MAEHDFIEGRRQFKTYCQHVEQDTFTPIVVIKYPEIHCCFSTVDITLILKNCRLGLIANMPL